jgi:predicted transcriptional regulator
MNVHEEGLNRFLGPLEARVMDIIWTHKKIRIKEVHEILDGETSISFNTVMTVMDRLHEKGYLMKTSGHDGKVKPYYYEPVQSKEEFIKEQTRAVTNGLIHEFGDLVVSHMIDAMEDADPSLLDKLQNKIDQMKRRGRL